VSIPVKTATDSGGFLSADFSGKQEWLENLVNQHSGRNQGHDDAYYFISNVSDQHLDDNSIVALVATALSYF